MHGLGNWLFDANVGEPGPGGNWPPWLSVVFHGSNLVIALVDFAIPLVILRYWKFRRDGVTPFQFWRTACFFPLVGISRLVRVLSIWGPAPHLAAVVDCATALLNLYCLGGILPFIRHVLKLPSRGQLHYTLNRLQVEMTAKEIIIIQVDQRREQVQAKLREAERRIEELTGQHKPSDWWQSRKQALAELGKMLDEIGDGSDDR